MARKERNTTSNTPRNTKTPAPADTTRDVPVTPETELPEGDAVDEGSGFSADARDERGWDGESTEYTPAPVETPDDDTVDGEDGSGADWTEAGVEGSRKLDDESDDDSTDGEESDDDADDDTGDATDDTGTIRRSR